MRTPPPRGWRASGSRRWAARAADDPARLRIFAMSASATTGSSETAGITAGTRLKLTEIFLSIQGEADSVGWPTVFVRLTGCPLRCQYCDTAYAFHGGEWF